MSFFQSFDLVGWQHFIKVIRPVKIHFQWFTEILLWALWSNHNKSNPQKQRLVKRNWMFCCLCAYHCTPWWRGYQCQHVCTRWLACSVGHPTHWRLGFWLSYSQWSYAENKKRSYRWQTARRTCAMQRCGWPLKPPAPPPRVTELNLGAVGQTGGTMVPPVPMGMWITPWKYVSPLPDMWNPAEFVRSKVKRSERDYRDPPEECDTLCPTFNGHSRSLELMDRSATYDFLLTWRSNHG